MDRHKKFARNWKSIALVSKMKWRARGDEINALILSMMGKALKGNVKAAEFVRDTSGQQPVQKVADTDSEGEDKPVIIDNIK